MSGPKDNIESERIIEWSQRREERRGKRDRVREREEERRGLEEREGWGNIMNNIRGGYFL